MQHKGARPTFERTARKQEDVIVQNEFCPFDTTLFQLD